MIRIIPSIASASMLDLGATLQKLGTKGSLHLDIEDGNFIPNITFGLKMVRQCAAATTLPLNAHLMTTNPMQYIGPLAECGVTEVAVHIESVAYPLQVLNFIRSLGMRPGLAFNFSTLIRSADPFLRECDFLLLMTSEEDGQGQMFHPSALGRIQEARSLLPAEKSIWVDGGVGEAQLPLVAAAGADTVVMGRAVVQAEDPAERIAYFSHLV